MDFKLSKAHLLQQEMFRKFAETEIKPIAKDMDCLLYTSRCV